jgi:hypothetical protein
LGFPLRFFEYFEFLKLTAAAQTIFKFATHSLGFEFVGYLLCHQMTRDSASPSVRKGGKGAASGKNYD